MKSRHSICCRSTSILLPLLQCDCASMVTQKVMTRHQTSRVGQTLTLSCVCMCWCLFLISLLRFHLPGHDIRRDMWAKSILFFCVPAFKRSISISLSFARKQARYVGQKHDHFDVPVFNRATSISFSLARNGARYVSQKHTLLDVPVINRSTSISLSPTSSATTLASMQQTSWERTMQDSQPECVYPYLC